MPFCRGCGKEIQDDWNSCPFCKEDIQVTNVQDSVVMGDIDSSTTINITKTSGDIKSMFLTALDCLKEGDIDEAESIFRNAKKKNHEEATKMFMGKNKKKWARGYLNCAKQMYGVDALAKFKLGNVESPDFLKRAREKEELYTKIVDIANKSLSLDANNVETMLFIATCYIDYPGYSDSKGDSGARKLLLKVKSIQPDNKELSILEEHLEDNSSGPFAYVMIIVATFFVMASAAVNPVFAG